MMDDRFDELMRDVASEYRGPPVPPGVRGELRADEVGADEAAPGGDENAWHGEE